MAIRPIRRFGDPILLTPAEPVTDFDRSLRHLAGDLTETLMEAGGAGLAAPQIGVGCGSSPTTWAASGAASGAACLVLPLLLPLPSAPPPTPCAATRADRGSLHPV